MRCILIIISDDLADPDQSASLPRCSGGRSFAILARSPSDAVPWRYQRRWIQLTLPKLDGTLEEDHVAQREHRRTRAPVHRCMPEAAVVVKCVAQKRVLFKNTASVQSEGELPMSSYIFVSPRSDPGMGRPLDDPILRAGVRPTMGTCRPDLRRHDGLAARRRWSRWRPSPWCASDPRW